ncbi:MAG: DUF1298 domain-containing protein [Betaproteobacteria bacterium]|nr:DUF1298 domain-containing protein [Betaproteobacteria bacterium]
MTHVKALSALDLAFFVLESRERMSNVGPLAILKLPARTRSAASFADRLLRAMQVQPVGTPFDMRYRGPGLHGLPRLESVPEVDAAAHCHRHTLPAPGTNAQLFEFVCRLHEKRLDRSRPHWDFKVHHGLLDGRGLVEVFRRWFGTDPADRSVRAPWNVLPLRTARSKLGPAARALDLAAVSGMATRATQAGRSMLSLYAALVRQTAASAGLTAGQPLPFVGTPGALRAKPSLYRSFAYCVLPLAEMKAFGKARGATVNDVLLTVLDMAMNRYLAEHGRTDSDSPLVADMPVALGEGSAGGSGGGNAIAILQFPLGAAAASPSERLAQVMQRTAELKSHVRRTDATALITYTAAVHGIPALLEVLHVPKAPMLATAVISNPFGLPERRYLAGAELEMALPLSVLAPGQALNITAATYDQGLQIAFLGLAAALPDIQRLADYSVEALARLTLPEATRPARKARAPHPIEET